jgi:hypothetical protein
MISNISKKKNFKIILNSFDVSSYTTIEKYATIENNFYNAVFPVDLKAIIRDPNDYKKSYNLTFSFQSIEDPNISYANTYAVYINMNKDINTMQNNNNNNYNKYTGILKFESPGSGRSINRFLTAPVDNPPVFYNTIENINQINIRVTNLANNLTYVPGTPGTQVPPAVINPPVRYWICVLCFTEV